MLETRAYRVAVVEDERIGDLLTQSDVIAYIWSHRASFATQMSHTLLELGLAYKQVLSCCPTGTCIRRRRLAFRRSHSDCVLYFE